MSRVTVDELMDELYEMLDRAAKLPLSGGKCLLDPEEVRSLLNELRECLPEESRQARAIVADRSHILNDARREADAIIRTAEERARVMVSQDVIVRQAQDKANDLLEQTQQKVREMRQASNDYVDDLMLRVDDAVAATLSELRKTRQNIKATQRSGQH